MKKKNPISCVFYDWIEHYATKKEVVEIRINTPEGEQLIRSRILDTRAEKGKEYILLENNQEWLDLSYLIAINEHKLSDLEDC